METYDCPAPLPAPATPFPAAVTTAPAALPTPDVAADAVLEMAPDAPFAAFVSHDCWAGGVGMCGCFFCAATGRGTGFLTVVFIFFCAVTGGGMGFFCMAVDVMGFLGVVEAMGALRTAVGVVFLAMVPGMAFLEPMGWATIFTN
jgi:hypothetical protein